MTGMDVLRERIADVVRAHRHGTSADAYKCMCGELWTSQHVADAVIAALRLTEDWDEDCWDGGSIPIRRWTTPWERIEEDA